MFIEAKLIPKSYKPLKLEKGMLFVTIQNEAIHLHEMTMVPKDVELYTQLNGWPVELYILYEGNPNLNEMEILAKPEQIGWFDKGNDSDEISDITVKQINTIFSDYDGYLAIEIGSDGEPTLYDDKVTIRTLDEQEEYNEEDILIHD